MNKKIFFISFTIILSLFMFKVEANDKFCLLPSNMTDCPENGVKVKKICSTYSYYDNNGNLITKNVDGYSCCKNGYEISVNSDNSYSYNIINTALCNVCPDNGTNINGLCCKNGFSNRTGKYNYYNPEECKMCPDNGTMIFPYGKDIPYCVNKKTKWAFNTKTNKYNKLMPNILGCPDNSMNKGSWCCKGKYTYDENTSSWTKYDTHCGCPDNGKKVTKHYLIDRYETACCKNNFKYNPQTRQYDILDETFCPVKMQQKIKNDIHEIEFYFLLISLNGFLFTLGISIYNIILLIVLIFIIFIVVKKIFNKKK